MGSLTAPPCSEGVKWNFVLDPLLITPWTYDKVKSIIKFNSRYIQNTLGDINLLDAARNQLNRAS